MRRVKIILVAAMAISLAGCILGGKPKPVASSPAPPQPAPTPPAEPLSLPQPHPDLPPVQPFDNQALKTAPPEPTPPVPQTSAQPPAQSTHGTNSAKPPVGAVRPVDAAPEPPPPEPARPPIQEILSPTDQKQFQKEAEEKAEANRLVTLAEHRHLNTNERKMATDIKHYLAQCMEAENNKDMRAAYEFAHKANLLAKDLQGGK